MFKHIFSYAHQLSYVADACSNTYFKCIGWWSCQKLASWHRLGSNGTSLTKFFAKRSKQAGVSKLLQKNAHPGWRNTDWHRLSPSPIGALDRHEPCRRSQALSMHKPVNLHRYRRPFQISTSRGAPTNHQAAAMSSCRGPKISTCTGNPSAKMVMLRQFA